jgi:hypothetical protein
MSHNSVLLKRSRKQRWFLIALLIASIWLIFISVVVWLLSAQGQFTLATGLSCPSMAKVIATGDNHGGFTGDGEFYLIIECDPATIQRWLTDHPFWVSQWRPGPVPPEIGFHCHFGSSEMMGYCTLPDGSQEYSGGSAEVREVLSSPHVWYAAKNRCPSIPYHQGNLLVVDPESGKVWYSDWKW